MAMTLKSEPPKIGTAHNDLIFVIDSDNKTETNYKYICDVYINAVRVARLKNNPNPNFGNYGVFNVNKVIQSYLNSDYFSADPVLSYINPYVVYVIKFSERYETSGSEVVNNDDVVVSEKLGYNASYSYLEAPLYEEDAAGDNTILYRKFVTNRDKYISVPDFADFYMTGYTYYPASIGVSVITFSLKVTTYTGLNQTGTSSTTTFPAAISKVHDFIGNFGTKGLDNAGISISGIQSYKVEFFQDGVVLRDTLYFNVDLCEPKHEIIHLVFLNRLGGFESVYFTKASFKSEEIERKEMQAQGTVFNTTTFKLDKRDSNNTFYEAHKTYGVRYNDTMKINSDWLSDADYVWLTDLVNSPVVYMEKTIPAAIGIPETTSYVPVRITNKDFDFKKKVNDKLSQIQLELNVGFNNYSQFR